MSDKLKIGLQFFADQSPGAHIYIYSNDGAELLGTVNSDTWKGVLLTVGLFYNEYYKCISNVIADLCRWLQFWQQRNLHRLCRRIWWGWLNP